MVTYPVIKSRPPNGSVGLLVVDNHAMVRRSLVHLLDRTADFQVVGEAADGEEAIRQAEVLQPDAIIMDVSMPNMDGIEATRRIKERNPDIVIIGLSMQDDKSIVKAMNTAGADAFISKNASARHVVDMIRQTCQDDTRKRSSG